MFNKFMNWLVPKLEDWCISKDRLILISGTDDPENVYLRRCVLFRSAPLSIYIHRFMRSDKDDHHDHPFDFFGYIVSGKYTESMLKIGKWKFSESSRKQGTWAFRKAEDCHMVKLDRHYSQNEYKEAPLTVIIRGPYRRQWGFWKKADKGFHWVYWRDYLNVPETDVRE